MYSDFRTIKVLADDKMISHMYWMEDNTVFGCLRYKGKNGFYLININTEKFSLCVKMTELATDIRRYIESGSYLILIWIKVGCCIFIFIKI